MWLVLRRLGLTRLIIIGYALAAIAPLAWAAMISRDPTTEYWSEMWWLVPVSAVALGAWAHWSICRDWRYYEEGKNARERLERVVGQASAGRRAAVFVLVALWMGACWFTAMMFVEDEPKTIPLAFVAAAFGVFMAWFLLRRKRPSVAPSANARS